MAGGVFGSGGSAGFASVSRGDESRDDDSRDDESRDDSFVMAVWSTWVNRKDGLLCDLVRMGDGETFW